MKVALVAHTQLTSEFYDETPWIDYSEWSEKVFTHSPDMLAEFGGRACYESWDRPNPKTATNRGYLENIIKQQHFSVLEHASATFYITGISRALLLELERHRKLSYSVASQRYIDHSDADVVSPPLFDEFSELQLSLDEHTKRSQELYREAVRKLEAEGYSRKEARGAARYFLPEGTETKVVLSGNMQAFRHVINMRNSPAADIEIRLLAQEILRHLKRVAPNTFQDMEVD